MAKRTRIFYTSDVHGSERCFLKFVNASKFYNADAIILGGDITGKYIVPIIERSDGTFKAHFAGSDFVMNDKEELKKLEKKIREAGYYPYCTNSNEIEELSSDKIKLDELFTYLMCKSVERWVEIAEEKLKGTGIKCFIMPGNDDRFDIDSILEASDYVINPEGMVTNVDESHEMISCCYSNITPWKAPRDIPEEDLADKIESMASRVIDMTNCIFNFHCPPFNSGIDVAPKLDETLKPMLKAGRVLTASVGSRAVRTAIKRYQPLLGLHGHIHESRGIARIGRTLCFNPGSEYPEGILRGVIVDLDHKGIKQYLLISG